MKQQSKRNCVENAIAAKNERGWKFCQESFTTFTEVKESQNSDSLVADKHELIKDNNGNNNDVADCTLLCLATTSPKTDGVTSPQESETNKLGTDDRTISEEQLCTEVCEDNRLSTEQQEDLYNVLAKYQQNLTKQPGKCTQFEYEFNDNQETRNVRKRVKSWQLIARNTTLLHITQEKIIKKKGERRKQRR